jgi:glucoamylase
MIERWTVTDEGTLLAGVPRYYVRICPADPGDPRPAADPNRAVVDLRNQEPGAQTQFAAKDVVDGGFLELVRYGIRRADDPVIVDTVKVVDAVLAVDLPGGRCWRRYNHDGYGQRADGGPFVTWGYGHAWPVLTGERGHYELAVGRDPTPSMRTMEALATSTALLPEQVWMLKDLPAKHMYFGRPTGGATPLVWAHGEYLRLVRSAADGRVFDLIPEVAERYQKRRPASAATVWMFRFQTATVRAGGTLRVQAEAAFRLRWTVDGWKNANDTEATKTGFGVWFADVKAPKEPKAAVEFTFYWTESQKWEGTNFRVEVEGS